MKEPIYFEITPIRGIYKYRISVGRTPEEARVASRLYFNSDYSNYMWWAKLLARKMARKVRAERKEKMTGWIK